MTPQWISIGIAILVQTATIAFVLGGVMRDVKALKDRERDDNALRDKVIQVETRLEAMKEDTSSIKRSIEGIQRTLANIAQRGLEFHGAAE